MILKQEAIYTVVKKNLYIHPSRQISTEIEIEMI